MFTRNRVRFLILALVIVAIASLALVATVSASHRTDMQTCAEHGLGPNFAYAEGPDSALMSCLARVADSGDPAHGD